jgi:hypothetical protein
LTLTLVCIVAGVWLRDGVTGILATFFPIVAVHGASECYGM